MHCEVEVVQDRRFPFAKVAVAHARDEDGSMWAAAMYFPKLPEGHVDEGYFEVRARGIVEGVVRARQPEYRIEWFNQPVIEIRWNDGR